MSSRLLANRYELIEKIGEGGMAVVYKGKDRLLNRFVAIKILRPEYTKDNKFVENFIRESQSAAGLVNPNIVGVYDVGNEGNIHYIVMELITGKPLSDVIKEKGKLNYKEAISIISQVASALSVAHKNQIIHRDVKPHNIIIMPDGTAKLADFGIAKAVSAKDMAEENNDKVMGSVHYFSPEQARGAYVDERSDIYSLGIVLYEMLTGKVPFDGENPVSIALMHVNNPMPKLTDEVPGIPPKLEKIVNKCTEKIQINRYRYVDELIKDLDDITFISNVMGKQAFGGLGIENPENTLTPEQEAEQRLKIRKEKSEALRAQNRIEKKKARQAIENKKTYKFIAIGVGSLIVIGLLVLALALGWFDKSEEFELPNFVGMTYEQAIAEAESRGLIINRGEDVFSTDQEEGFVTAQSPSAKALVKEGKAVTINVSKGKRSSVIPKITGSTVDEARKILSEYGFTLGEVAEIHSGIEKGIIITQSINPGDQAQSGTKVDVQISDGIGDKMLTVPNLVGHIPQEAEVLLEVYGFPTDGIVTYEEVADYPSNIIFWQSVAYGDKVPADTRIDYKIAKAKPGEPTFEVEFDREAFREEVLANLEFEEEVATEANAN